MGSGPFGQGIWGFSSPEFGLEVDVVGNRLGKGTSLVPHPVGGVIGGGPSEARIPGRAPLTLA